MFTRLVVPIIGNAASSVAVGFAIDVAKAHRGEVTFCYALDTRVLGMGDYVDSSWTQLLRPDAEKVGKLALARAAQAGCPATLQVIDGSAEDVILQLAPAFDLVVMGTRAIAGVAQVLEHSVTDAIVRVSTRPVLVVREWDTAPQTSPDNVIFRRLIVPIDGSSASQGAIDLANALAAGRDEELLFVYALDRARATTFSGPFAFDDGGAFDVMRQFGTELLAKAQASARAAGAAHVSTRLLDGAPIDAILKAISDEKGDAVVIGTHGRQGLDRAVHGSVTETLIRTSPVPIVALHSPTPGTSKRG
jgi:nucleotide-binding universal stress UspA family protein